MALPKLGGFGPLLASDAVRGQSRRSATMTTPTTAAAQGGTGSDSGISIQAAGAPHGIRYGLGNRCIVITGAAQGIGAACARRLAAEGAAVALWDSDATHGLSLATELQGLGCRIHFAHCDVSNSASVAQALADSQAALGPVDGLVNNAGIFRAADFLHITEADWDAVIAVNLKGAFLVAQAVARAMVAQAQHKPFAIVNMSSVNGTLAIPNIASYNASKGAVDQLTRAMALSLADHGIRVNAVAPGTIATDLARAAVLGSEQAKARIMGRTPLRRLGEPSEIAEVVAFLLSRAASYMTGEVVFVDGGRMALNYTMPEAPPPALG